jgi:hypothetical protein
MNKILIQINKVVVKTQEESKIKHRHNRHEPSILEPSILDCQRLLPQQQHMLVACIVVADVAV